MKRIFFLLHLMLASTAFASDYKCSVANPTFHDRTDIVEGDGEANVDVSTSFPLKKAELKLSNNRVGVVVIMKGIFGQGKTVLQLQLFADETKKEFITYVAGHYEGLPKEMRVSGQYLNPQTKLYDEYHVTCSKN